MITTPVEKIKQYTEANWWTEETLFDLFERNVRKSPDALAVVDQSNREEIAAGDPKRYTYIQLKQAVDNLASQLIRLEIGKDDVVMVQLPNVVELVVVYLAAARIGAIVSPLAIQYRTHELRQVMELTEPKAFITTTDFQGFNHVAMVQELQPEFPSVEHVIATGDNIPGKVHDLESLLTRGDEVALSEYLQRTSWTANDIFTICWTSGTVAEPKGVPRSHNHWTSIAYFTTDGCEIDAGANLLNPFPLVNMSAIGGMLVPWLQTGGKLVMHHPLNLPVFLGQIMTEQINYTVAPPVLLNLLLVREQMLEKVDLSTIKNIGSGSAPLSPWMVQGWDEKHGIKVLNMFGANEGTALVSGPRDVPDAADRAQYFPRFGVEGHEWSVPIAGALSTKLVDPLTKEIITEPGVSGELAISGPTIFDGYYKRPELTAEAFDEDGYFYTGDLFEIAGEGDRYRFVGRLKDLIIRGGMKISPEEIEAILQEYDKIQDVAVVGGPTRRPDDEDIWVVAVPKEEQELTLNEVVDFVKSKDVANYKHPKHLLVVPALPRNPVGKILKRELRETVRAEAG